MFLKIIVYNYTREPVFVYIKLHADAEKFTDAVYGFIVISYKKPPGIFYNDESKIFTYML